MTQENKFAIIIGFALLLVVGILVSDHLAEVARGAPGSLAVIDPTASNDHRTIEYLPLVTSPSPAPAPAAEASDAAASLPTNRGLTHPVHIVAAGDTLSGIAAQHYGDRRRATDLAVHNGLPNPNDLREGLRLIIPPSSLLGTEPEAAPSPPQATGPQAAAAIRTSRTIREYEVRPGDTLSELAQQLMGSARHTSRLLELNRDRISSADDLRIGIKLRYPDTASGNASP
ncbi:MAG: LysM domain-containing protein [Phycisphaerales bacterium]|jgi:nucleoid-associated protein YgaU|nr:LysM domain-containing protein [Phycisphaerales bacterium]